MLLLISLTPISLGILNYIFKKKSFLLVLTSYILTFLFIFLAQEGSMVIGNYSALKGIEFEFNVTIRILLLSFNIFSLIVLLRIINKYDYVFFSLWLLLIGSINGFFMSRDFFNLYVHLELASILIFLLLAYDKNEIRIWASLKYMIMSLVALNLYLIGVGILYSHSGTLNINYNLSNGINNLAFSFILTGLLIKGGFFFLSGWLPNAHTEAVKGVSPILSGVIVKLPIFIIYLLYSSIPDNLKNFLYVFAIITAITSSFFTLLQDDIKKFFAYSTMSQMSYGLIILMVQPSIFPYFIIYHMFSKGFLFMIAEDIYEENQTKNLQELKGVKLPIDTLVLLSFLLLNLSGLFPFSLFILKDNLSLSYFLEINIFIFGMYFYKLLSTFYIKKNLSYKHWYIIIFIILNIFGIAFYLISHFSELSFLKISSQYLFFLLGIFVYFVLKDKISFRPIEIYNFQNSFIYQIAFLLLIMLIEI